MPSCVVKWCKNNSINHKKSQGITFHRFPKSNEPLNHDWIEAIRVCRGEKDWNPSNTSVVCSIHFDAADLYITERGRRRVFAYAIPKLLLVQPSNNVKEKLPEPIMPLPIPQLLVQPSNNVKENQPELIMPFPIPQTSTVIEIETMKSEPPSPSTSLPPSPPSLLQEMSTISETETIKLEPLLPTMPSPTQDALADTEPETIIPEQPLLSTSSPSPQATMVETVTIKFEPPSPPPPSPPPPEPPVLQTPLPVQDPSTFHKIRTYFLKEALEKKKISNKKSAQKIKTLNQKIRRLKSRNDSLKSALRNLKKHNYVYLNKTNENEAAVDLFNIYNRKKLKKQIVYSHAIKEFCLTLNYYSPKAYDYIRQTFDTCLPHPKTLAKWCGPVKDHLNSSMDPEFIDHADSSINPVLADYADSSINSMFSDHADSSLNPPFTDHADSSENSESTDEST